jgi:hypothetical protein
MAENKDAEAFGATQRRRDIQQKMENEGIYPNMDQRTSEKQKMRIHPEVFVKQLKAILPSVPMTTQDMVELRQILANRMINKTCFKCAKVKPEADGIMTYPDGDMSRPKRFVCGDCK